MTPAVPVQILPMGDAALLVETAGIDAVLAIEAALAAQVVGGRGPWADVEDLVPAARTVLVVAKATTDLASLSELVTRTLSDVTATGATGSTDPVEIPVRYDGPDLPEVARLTGLSEEDVISAHTGTPWRVGFGGFAPGFAYLVDGDPRLRVPRRDSPRTKLPAGSVALAGEFSAVYPRESPGGWQIIGSTDVQLWDLEREQPALLRPGDAVQFVAVTT